MKNCEISDFVIIGGVATGPKAAASLARRLPNAKITLFEKGEYISYASCGLPYLASGDIESFEKLSITSYGVKRDAEFFKHSKGFDVVTGAVVTRINRDRKCITVKMANTGEEVEHGYNRLILATGGVSQKPAFSIAQSPLIRPFTRPEDALFFRTLAQQGKIAKAVIIGGGMIGCELAEAMRGLWDIETTLIEKESQLLPYALDPEMAAIVQREMNRNGTEILTQVSVKSIDIGSDGRPISHLCEGDKITSDIVFLCLGIRAEVSLAAECGLAIGKTGAIVVDEFMRTSDHDIFAGGDCVESYHQITKKKIYLPMGSIANRHGRVIAENLTGNWMEFPAVLGAFFMKSFDVNIGAVGLTEKAAVQNGCSPKSVWASFSDKPDYYPESKVITLKMTYCRHGGHLIPLGLQAVGTGDICRRIDVFSALLGKGSTIVDLLDFEHGYAPPYSEAVDPLQHLAAIAIAKERGLDIIGPDLACIESGINAIYLDVREAEESALEILPLPKIGQLINIPLNDLGDRLGELDRQSEIVVVCKRGPRAYQAAVILKNAGYNKVKIIGGGIQAML